MTRKSVFLTAALLAGLLMALMAPAVAQTGVCDKCGPHCKALHSRDALPGQQLLPHQMPPTHINPPIPAGKGTWEQCGPEGGSYYGVAVDPANADNATIYGSGYYSGAVRTTKDGGLTWTKTGSIHFSPYDLEVIDQNTVYGLGYDYTTYSYGVWSTTDGGTNWNAIGPALSAYFYPYSIAVDRSNMNNIYLGVYEYDIMGPAYKAHCYVTSDGGVNWTQVTMPSGGVPYCADISRQNPNVVYMGGFDIDFITYMYSPRLWQSTDSGATWTEIGPAYNPLEYYVYNMTVDPMNDQNIYLGGYYGYMTNDGGSTWNEVDFGNDICYGIAVDPVKNAYVYYVTGSGVVHKSGDYGATWKASTGLIPGYCNGMVVAPSSPSTLWAACTYAAVAKSIDQGDTWAPMAGGLLESTIYGLEVSTGEPENVFCSPYGLAQMVHSAQSGLNWQNATLPPEGTYTTDLLVNSEQPNILTAILPGG